MPDPVLNAFQGLSHLIITKASDVGTNNTHFTNEETKTWGR